MLVHRDLQLTVEHKNDLGEVMEMLVVIVAAVVIIGTDGVIVAEIQRLNIHPLSPFLLAS